MSRPDGCICPYRQSDLSGPNSEYQESVVPACEIHGHQAVQDVLFDCITSVFHNRDDAAYTLIDSLLSEFHIELEI